MGRKMKLSVHRKNKELKKTTKVAGAGYECTSSLVVSLPMEQYRLATVSSLSVLRDRIKILNVIPRGWMDVTDAGTSCDTIQFSLFHDSERQLVISMSIIIKDDLTWKLSFHGQMLGSHSPALSFFPAELSSVSAFENLLTHVSGCSLCCGNQDERFATLAERRKGKFMSSSGTAVVAYYESSSPSTIRSTECFLLVSKCGGRCPTCTKYRVTLRSMLQRLDQASEEDWSNPSSHMNLRYLDTPQKISRIKSLRIKCQSSHAQVERLKQKLDECIEQRGTALDSVLHQDLVTVMEENNAKVVARYPEGSFQRIFWEQQRQAATVKTSHGMRWDPLMIRWCLYLRHLSGSAYELLRQSGTISLPSQRTLRDYTYHTTARVGFAADVDEQLMKVASIDSCPDREKYVILLMDEMHIKADLVYDKHSGSLIGFTNIGDINSHLQSFENNLEKEERLAESMLVMMVRGLFSKVQFPYVQFPCVELSGDQMYEPLWNAVGRLECCGFRVLALVCDGLAANRRLFRLHDPIATEVYKVPNPFASDGRYLYFLSDPPHLIKTVRNAWYNSKRRLWCCGKEILWSHLVELYEKNRSETGLSLIPKLKYEHIYMTSFSKMRVDLAAQVLSTSVAKGLEFFGKEGTEETMKFVAMFDRFFDCFNVSTFLAGKHSRNPFKSPYYSYKDFRLKWLQEDFLEYLRQWESSVQQRQGFSRMCRNKMMLPPETLLGLRITVKSFIELVKFILALPDVSVFLSNRLCQDPIEKFFGQQRQRGRVNENPNAVDFMKNTQALRVIHGVCRDVKGNCRGHSSQELNVNKLSLPLQKRRYRRRSA